MVSLLNIYLLRNVVREWPEVLRLYSRHLSNLLSIGYSVVRE